MIKGKYLRERKAIKVKRKFKLLIALLTVSLLYKIVFATFSIYESEATSTADLSVAVYVLRDAYQVRSVALNDIAPDGNTQYYNFTISNFMVDEDTGETFISETDMEYTLGITATTNLPLEYTLYKDASVNVGSSILDTSENHIYADSEDADDATLYKSLVSTSQLDSDTKATDHDFFVGNEPKTYNYTLGVTFPDTEENKNADYQSLFECIDISVESKQIIDE